MSRNDHKPRAAYGMNGKIKNYIVRLNLLESAGEGGLIPRGLSGSLGHGLGSRLGMIPFVCGGGGGCC